MLTASEADGVIEDKDEHIFYKDDGGEYEADYYIFFRLSELIK